jgi:hypothetical protein
MPILRTHTRTLVSDDETALLTYLGALRRACAGQELREDAQEFLRKTEHLPENLAVYVSPKGFALVTDNDGEPLVWYATNQGGSGL